MRVELFVWSAPFAGWSAAAAAASDRLRCSMAELLQCCTCLVLGDGMLVMAMIGAGPLCSPRLLVSTTAMGHIR